MASVKEEIIMSKALFLDTINKSTRVVDVNTLEDYYKLIGCRCIDIVTRKIGRKVYDIICDDEGALTDDPLISAIDDIGRVMLVGNLIVCGLADDEGELTDLNPADIRYIKKRVQTLDTRKHADLLMLTSCNYC